MPKIPTEASKGKPVPRIYIGIDPGQNGGLVALYSSGKIEATPMPDTERGVWEWFSSLPILPYQLHAVIEKVHAMPDQGVTSMFTFGYGYGGVRMALIAREIPFEEVQPRAWQKALGIPPKKKEEEKNQFKVRLLRMAQQLHPSLPEWKVKRSETKQKAIADALLIATYCQRKNEGNL